MSPEVFAPWVAWLHQNNTLAAHLPEAYCLFADGTGFRPSDRKYKSALYWSHIVLLVDEMIVFRPWYESPEGRRSVIRFLTSRWARTRDV